MGGLCRGCRTGEANRGPENFVILVDGFFRQTAQFDRFLRLKLAGEAFRNPPSALQAFMAPFFATFSALSLLQMTHVGPAATTPT